MRLDYLTNQSTLFEILTNQKQAKRIKSCKRRPEVDRLDG